MGVTFKYKLRQRLRKYLHVKKNTTLLFSHTKKNTHTVLKVFTTVWGQKSAPANLASQSELHKLKHELALWTDFVRFALGQCKLALVVFLDWSRAQTQCLCLNYGNRSGPLWFIRFQVLQNLAGNDGVLPGQVENRFAGLISTLTVSKRCQVRRQQLRLRRRLRLRCILWRVHSFRLFIIVRGYYFGIYK